MEDPLELNEQQLEQVPVSDFRRMSAIHEAGHAVVGVLGGCILTRVWIAEGENPTGYARFLCSGFKLDREVFHRLAGAAAERVFFGFTSSAVRLDNAAVLRWTRESAMRGEFGPQRRAEENRRAYVREMRRRVRISVASPIVKGAIAALADAVLARGGHLVGAECIEVIQPWFAAEDSAGWPPDYDSPPKAAAYSERP